MRKKTRDTKEFVLAAVFVAIIIVMTFVPYTGYITYLPGGISMTTLHVPVILGAVLLGPGYGALLGGVWGMTCIVRALLEPTPANLPFVNPLVSLMPRIAVGVVAALVFMLCSKKTKKGKSLPHAVAAALAALAGTLTNTVLVLSMFYVFNGNGETTVATVFSDIIFTLVGINGVLELVAAVLLVGSLYEALRKSFRDRYLA